jgi:hypothetical protein
VISGNEVQSNSLGDLTLAGTGNEASSNSFSGAISISGTTNLFQKNTSRDCGNTVAIDGSAHVIAKNRFTGGGSLTLALTSSAVVVQQNEFFGNCGSPVVAVNGGADHVFSKNTITGRGVPHFYIGGGSNLQFLGNVTRGGVYGFYAYGGTDLTFVGNIASGHSGYGFGVTGAATNVVMEKNVSIGNGSYGFNFNPQLTLKVTGNSAIGNKGGGIFIAGAATITGNNIFGNDPATNCGLTQAGISLATATGNFWGDAAGPGAVEPADNVCGNPVFVDATSPADTAFKVKAAKATPY